MFLFSQCLLGWPSVCVSWNFLFSLTGHFIILICGVNAGLSLSSFQAFILIKSSFPLILSFSFISFLCIYHLNNVTTSVDIYFQDCSGVILCAAERATQVALQVKEHSHSFVYEFQNFMFSRSTKIEWICTNIKSCLKYLCFTARPLLSPQGFFFIFFLHHIAPGHLNHHFYSCHDERLWTSYSSTSSHLRGQIAVQRG